MTTASIHDLSAEILTEIFYFTQAPFQVHLNHHRYPWTLCLVCTHWRDTIFNTPELWADLTIDLSEVHESQLEKYYDTWKLCLERAKDHPLSISIHTSDPAFLPQLLESSVQHIHQWEHVEFLFPMDTLVPLIPDPIVPYPRLRSLVCMGSSGMPVQQQIPLKLERFRDAPRLSKLDITGIISPLSTSTFPWSQITDFSASLTGEKMTVHIFNLLHSMPSLVSLKFWDNNTQPTLDLTTGILRLSHLQNLTWMSGPASIIPFFDSAEAPLLTEITFSDPQGVDEKMKQSALRFLRKSNCSIRTIKLLAADEKPAVALLSLFSNIETLVLEVFMSDNELLQALAYDETESNWLCPKMKRLVLKRLYLSPWESGRYLVSMIKSRLRVAEGEDDRGCRLVSIHVVAEDQSEVESYIRLQDKVPCQNLSSTFTHCAQFYVPHDTPNQS